MLLLGLKHAEILGPTCLPRARNYRFGLTDRSLNCKVSLFGLLFQADSNGISFWRISMSLRTHTSNQVQSTARFVNATLWLLGGLLVANLLVMVAKGPASAPAMVQPASSIQVAAVNTAAPVEPAVPTSTVEQLQRVIEQVAIANERLARIESKLSGELKVKVTSMPASVDDKK
jgi:hypothetical protein